MVKTAPAPTMSAREEMKSEGSEVNVFTFRVATERLVACLGCGLSASGFSLLTCPNTPTVRR